MEVGFWQSYKSHLEDLNDDRPNPTALVDDEWYAEASASGFLTILHRYLCQTAYIESYEFGYSVCRFSNCLISQETPKVMGACTMTDGIYYWPEGYWHYISCHHVKPPVEFLVHIEYEVSRNPSKYNQDNQKQNLVLWDIANQTPQQMPKEIQEWILSYTTIQL